jgi:hypothetical protein
MVPALAGPPRRRLPEALGAVGLALRSDEQRFDQQGQPLLRLPEDERSLAAGKDFAAHRLAAHRLTIGLRHGQRARVELARHVPAGSARAPTGPVTHSS